MSVSLRKKASSADALSGGNRSGVVTPMGWPGIWRSRMYKEVRSCGTWSAIVVGISWEGAVSAGL